LLPPQVAKYHEDADKVKLDWHFGEEIKIYSSKTRFGSLLRIKFGAKLWLCEAIYQTLHLKIPILGILSFPQNSKLIPLPKPKKLYFVVTQAETSI
jgi:hypothetical protein